MLGSHWALPTPEAGSLLPEFWKNSSSVTSSVSQAGPCLLQPCVISHTDQASPHLWLNLLEYFLCHLGQVISVSSTQGGPSTMVAVLCDHESERMDGRCLPLLLLPAGCSKSGQELPWRDRSLDWLLLAPATHSVSNLCQVWAGKSREEAPPLSSESPAGG